MLEEGDLEGALRLCMSCPEDPDVLNVMGASLRGLGRYGEAAACFERSLRMDPRDRDAS